MSIVTLSTDIQNSGDTVPEWIQLLPDSNEFSALDGREFVIKDAKEIISLSAHKNVDMHIDYEHSIKDKSTDPKPATGWIKELAIKDGAIWGVWSGHLRRLNLLPIKNIVIFHRYWRPYRQLTVNT